MNEEVIDWMRQHERPFATASELADAMGVQNSAIHKRLDELEEDGKVKSKQVGGRAKVYYLPERDNSVVTN